MPVAEIDTWRRREYFEVFRAAACQTALRGLLAVMESTVTFQVKGLPRCPGTAEGV